LRAGAGVGVATVGDDGTGVTQLHMLLGDTHTGSTHFIRGENGIGDGRCIGRDEREVETQHLRVFDSASHGRGAETTWSGDTTVNGFERHALLGARVEVNSSVHRE
jgi:hypothetical protein